MGHFEKIQKLNLATSWKSSNRRVNLSSKWTMMEINSKMKMIES